MILVSSTEVPAKLTTLFTSLACRQTYALYRADMYTLLVVTFNVFSALQVLKQCTWLVMRGDLQSFSIAHKLRHTHTSVYSYATSRAVHSWQDLPTQEFEKSEASHYCSSQRLIPLEYFHSSVPTTFA